MGGAAADGDWNIFLYGAVYIVRAVSVHSLTAEKVTSLKMLMYIYMMKGLWSGNEKKKKKGVVIIYKLEVHTYRVMYADILHL